jgi:hypothetical protein
MEKREKHPSMRGYDYCIYIERNMITRIAIIVNSIKPIPTTAIVKFRDLII